ncbi:putative ABC transporter ATP-binding protein [anaerobic digester metagenome]
MKDKFRLLFFASYVKSEIFKKIIINIIITITYLVQALGLAYGVNGVWNNNPIERVLPYLGIVLLAIFLRSYLIWYNEGYSRKIALKVKAKIRKIILEKLMNLGPSYQSEKRSGDLLALVTDGVESLENYLVNFIPQIFVVLITVVAVTVYIFRLDAVVGMIVLACVIFAVLWPFLSKFLKDNGYEGYWKAYGKLNAQYIDAMLGMNTLKAFNAGKQKAAELKVDARRFGKESIDATCLSLISSAAMILCAATATAMTVIIGAYHISGGNLAPASLSIILFLVPEVIRPLYDFNQYWHGSYTAFSVITKLDAVLDEADRINQNPMGLKELKKDPPEILFEDVSFSYQAEDRDVLKHINLVIKPGETVALVGKSGSGKSTLVKLLLRFYEPQNGALKINQQEVSAYELAFLRSSISVVFQDTYLFYGSVAENIAMARPLATPAEIKEAARIAGADAFIEALPEGYDTLVGERGATLSGGEKQRISIARAILKDAPILVLDEATSSVDSATEGAIQAAMDYLLRGKTALIIAHRLSTIKHADRIYVIDAGEVIEMGSHGALMKQNGYYATMIKTQRKGELKHAVSI